MHTYTYSLIIVKLDTYNTHAHITYLLIVKRVNIV